MRKMMKAIAAVLAVSALTAGSAFAADKLIVKGTDGTTTKFAVSDTGKVTLPQAGVGTNTTFTNPGGVDNFAQLAVTSDGTVANVATAMQMIPKGTGYPGFPIRAQLSVFGTDLIADSVNYESLVLRASGSDYSINATAAGTGQARPITFQMFNNSKVVYATNGYVGINPTINVSTGAVTVMPTHHLEVGNTATGAGSGTFAFYPVTQTTAPTAGAAAALPATPAGYATVTINGVDRKIAYY